MGISIRASHPHEHETLVLRDLVATQGRLCGQTCAVFIKTADAVMEPLNIDPKSCSAPQMTASSQPRKRRKLDALFEESGKHTFRHNIAFAFSDHVSDKIARYRHDNSALIVATRAR